MNDRFIVIVLEGSAPAEPNARRVQSAAQLPAEQLRAPNPTYTRELRISRS